MAGAMPEDTLHYGMAVFRSDQCHLLNDPDNGPHLFRSWDGGYCREMVNISYQHKWNAGMAAILAQEALTTQYSQSELLKIGR